MKTKIFLCSILISLICCKGQSPTAPEQPKNPPVINSFTASPAEIKLGESSILSWNTSNATKVEINQGIGIVSGSGSKTVSPIATTVYTLTASNDVGSIQKTCEVKIKLIGEVVMIEGPIFEDGYSIFQYKGIVKNIGNAEAKWVKIYIYIRKSNNDLITFEYTYADDSTLSPNETSAWNVLFWDDNKSVRNQMDKSKMTYEIKWD